MRWLAFAVTVMLAPTLTHAAPPSPAGTVRPKLEREGRAELAAGITLRAVGAIAFYAGFAVHGVGEGPGFFPYRSEAEYERAKRRSVVTAAIALTGAALMVGGAVLTALGVNRLYRSRSLALRRGSLSLRF